MSLRKCILLWAFGLGIALAALSVSCLGIIGLGDIEYRAAGGSGGAVSQYHCYWENDGHTEVITLFDEDASSGRIWAEIIASRASDQSMVVFAKRGPLEGIPVSTTLDAAKLDADLKAPQTYISNEVLRLYDVDQTFALVRKTGDPILAVGSLSGTEILVTDMAEFEAGDGHFDAQFVKVGGSEKELVFTAIHSSDKGCRVIAGPRPWASESQTVEPDELVTLYKSDLPCPTGDLIELIVVSGDAHAWLGKGQGGEEPDLDSAHYAFDLENPTETESEIPWLSDDGYNPRPLAFSSEVGQVQLGFAHWATDLSAFDLLVGERAPEQLEYLKLSELIHIKSPLDKVPVLEDQPTARWVTTGSSALDVVILAGPCGANNKEIRLWFYDISGTNRGSFHDDALNPEQNGATRLGIKRVLAIPKTQYFATAGGQVHVAWVEHYENTNNGGSGGTSNFDKLFHNVLQCDLSN